MIFIYLEAIALVLAIASTINSITTIIEAIIQKSILPVVVIWAPSVLWGIFYVVYNYGCL